MLALAAGCRLLQVVYFRRCSELTDASVIALAENCAQLRDVNLGGCRQVRASWQRRQVRAYWQRRQVRASWQRRQVRAQRRLRTYQPQAYKHCAYKISS